MVTRSPAALCGRPFLPSGPQAADGLLPVTVDQSAFSSFLRMATQCVSHELGDRRLVQGLRTSLVQPFLVGFHMSAHPSPVDGRLCRFQLGAVTNATAANVCVCVCVCGRMLFLSDDRAVNFIESSALSPKGAAPASVPPRSTRARQLPHVLASPRWRQPCSWVTRAPPLSFCFAFS